MIISINILPSCNPALLFPQPVLRDAVPASLRRGRPPADPGAGEGRAAHPLRPQLRRQELPAHQDLFRGLGEMVVELVYLGLIV